VKCESEERKKKTGIFNTEVTEDGTQSSQRRGTQNAPSRHDVKTWKESMEEVEVAQLRKNNQGR